MEGVRLLQRSRLLEDSVWRLGSVLRQCVELIVDVCAERVQSGSQVRGALAADHCRPCRDVLSSDVREYLLMIAGLAGVSLTNQ